MDSQTKVVLLQLLESSSDDDDSNSEEFYGKIAYSAAKTDIPANVRNFMDTIEDYSEVDFKSHLRLDRSTVERFVSNYSLSEFCPNSQHGGRTRIGAKREVYMYVWYICNILTFRQLGDLFGVSKSSAWIAVGRVCNWLITQVNLYIKWPQGSTIAKNCREFEAKKKLPGVVGALDCTHIIIKAPKINKERYYNRKQDFTIILQAVVDAEGKFIDICVGEPGSLDDCGVLRRSTLYKRAQTDYTRLFDSNTFILGASAYPAMNWLVPPYRDNGQLTDQQRSFNYLHTETRMIVEHTFHLLKGRFRRINKFTEQLNLQAVKKIVLSACILHNICIINNDQYTVTDPITHSLTDPLEIPSSSPEHKEDSENDTPVNRRQLLFEYLCENCII